MESVGPGPEQQAWLQAAVRRLRSAGYGALDARRDEPEVVSVGAFGGQIVVLYDDKRTKTLRVTVALWPPVSEGGSFFRGGSPVLHEDFVLRPDGTFVGEV